MTVDDVRTVDCLGLESGSGHVILTIVDPLDWDSDQEHIRLLEQKLNAYLAFVESGEVFERLHSEIGRAVVPSTPVEISILARYPMSAEGERFLGYATEEIRNAGFALTWKLVPLSPARSGD